MRLASLALCAAFLAGCQPPVAVAVKKLPSNNYHRNAMAVESILELHKPFAEASLNECVESYLRQGLPLKQVVELCGTRMMEDDKKGFGGDVGSLGNAGSDGHFDPASVSGTCSQGNPEFGKTPKGGEPVRGPVGYTVMFPGRIGVDYLYDKNTNERTEIFGQLSWGGEKGADVKDDKGEVVGTYNGLTKEESMLQKSDNVEASKKADAEANATDAKPNATAAEKKAAHDKADAAAKKALADPNVTPKGTSETAGGLDSPCETALQGARELLRECNRVGWKSTICQQVKAQMNRCPDPTLINIDPDAGYSCGDKPDPKAVVAAVQARCREITRPGPDGKDPCAPLKLDDAGWRQSRGSHDVCSDPHAYVDPDGAGCMVEVKVGKTFGAPDMDQIIIIAMDRLGGPLVVLPNKNPKPPKPGGPDPRPGPNP